MQFSIHLHGIARKQNLETCYCLYMNTYTLEKPIEWYAARLDYLYESVNKLPDIRLGKRNDRRTLRIFSSPHKYRQIGEKSKQWNIFFPIYEQRQILISKINVLRKELSEIYNTTYEDIRNQFKVQKNTTNMLNMNYYNNLIDNECSFTKHNNYEYDGHNFRSRFEMSVAREINNLGLEYKYDCGIHLSNKTLFMDFAIPFPEYDECEVIELFGCFDDTKYINDAAEKIKDYSNCGILLGSNFFALAATENSMPNGVQIRQLLVQVITAVSIRYSIPATN